MNKTTVILSALLVLLVWVTICPAESINVDSDLIIGSVNGQDITLQEYQDKIAELRELFRDPYAFDDFNHRCQLNDQVGAPS